MRCAPGASSTRCSEQPLVRPQFGHAHRPEALNFTRRNFRAMAIEPDGGAAAPNEPSTALVDVPDVTAPIDPAPRPGFRLTVAHTLAKLSPVADDAVTAAEPV